MLNKKEKFEKLKNRRKRKVLYFKNREIREKSQTYHKSHPYMNIWENVIRPQLEIIENDPAPAGPSCG